MQESVTKLRSAMVDIYPPDLSADGLESAIEELAGRLRSHNVSVDVSVRPRTEPDPEIAAALYRCAREGLANVAKHAHAQHVTLTVVGDADTISLWLHDDGVGLPPEEDRRRDGHIGLQLMRDAAADLGGRFDLTSSPGAGTTLAVRLPAASVVHR